MSKPPVNYEVKALNDSDYNILLTMEAEGRLLKSAFEKSKIALKRKKNLNVKGSIDAVNAFELDARYYGIVKTFLAKTFNLISAETKQDGFIMLNYHVKHGLFKRKKDADKWDIILLLEGRYIIKNA